MSNLLFIYLCFQIAMIGFVYAQILTEAGQLLNPLYKFLDKHLGKYPFIFKPLIDCYKCVSGQLFLWTYSVISFLDGWITQPIFFFNLIYGICLTIFIAIILNFINDRAKNT